MSNPWLVPATALAASFAIACGSSPTSPSSSPFSVAADEAAVAETSSAARSGLPMRPTFCDVKAVMLEAKPAAERRAWSVVATFKGDATACPAVDWSVFPSAPLSVDVHDPSSVVVFDNPSIKMGRVNVTATLRTGNMRLSQTIRVSFPRDLN